MGITMKRISKELRLIIKLLRSILVELQATRTWSGPGMQNAINTTDDVIREAGKYLEGKK